MRGDQEIVVVVRRGPEFLVMRRAPERLGYWSLVAGGLEPDETPREAAQRELFEETGLEPTVRPLRSRSYSLLDDPPAIRARYAPGVEKVTVHAFVVDAPVNGSRRSTPSTIATSGAISTRPSGSSPTRRRKTPCALRHESRE